MYIRKDAVKYLACAIEFRVKDMIEKLASVVNHRHINFKVKSHLHQLQTLNLALHQEDLHHEACSDVKFQINFLQEVNQIKKKRYDEAERKVWMKALKVSSSSSTSLHHLQSSL